MLGKEINLSLWDVSPGLRAVAEFHAFNNILLVLCFKHTYVKATYCKEPERSWDGSDDVMNDVIRQVVHFGSFRKLEDRLIST